MASSRDQKDLGAYIVTRTRLGFGSYATVFEGVEKATGRKVAVKSINKDRLNRKLIENLELEISILEALDHPNVVQLFHVHRSVKHIYLVLEYCEGGDLAKFVKKHGPMPIAAAQRFVNHISNALYLLRSRGLVHRDLKPHNLLLTCDSHEATIKLTDFGFARYMIPSSLAETVCGSPLYMAPEILSMKKYDASADLWSVGTILYEMVFGKPPYTGLNHLDLLKNIETMPVTYPDSVPIPPVLRNLLDGLLQRNPADRMSYDDFFSHAFVNLDKAVAEENVRMSMARISHLEVTRSSSNPQSPPVATPPILSNPQSAVSTPSGPSQGNGPSRTVPFHRPRPSVDLDLVSPPPDVDPEQLKDRVAMFPAHDVLPVVVPPVSTNGPNSIVTFAITQDGKPSADSAADVSNTVGAGEGKSAAGGNSASVSKSSRADDLASVCAFSSSSCPQDSVPRFEKAELLARVAWVLCEGMRVNRASNNSVTSLAGDDDDSLPTTTTLAVCAFQILLESLSAVQSCAPCPRKDATVRWLQTQVSDIVNRCSAIIRDTPQHATMVSEFVIYRYALELGSRAAVEERLDAGSAVGLRLYGQCRALLDYLSKRTSLSLDDRRMLDSLLQFVNNRYTTVCAKLES